MKRPYIISHMMVSVDDCPMVAQISDEGYWMALDSLGTSSKLSGRVTAALECSAVREDLSAEADGRPLLVILSEDVSAVHLEMLRKNHVSWIATGKNHIDLQRAVEILAEQFKVSRLVLVGGGNINGGFLEAGLVDEVSVMRDILLVKMTSAHGLCQLGRQTTAYRLGKRRLAPKQMR